MKITLSKPGRIWTEHGTEVDLLRGFARKHPLPDRVAWLHARTTRNTSMLTFLWDTVCGGPIKNNRMPHEARKLIPSNWSVFCFGKETKNNEPSCTNLFSYPMLEIPGMPTSMFEKSFDFEPGDMAAVKGYVFNRSFREKVVEVMELVRVSFVNPCRDMFRVRVGVLDHMVFREELLPIDLYVRHSLTS